MHRQSWVKRTAFHILHLWRVTRTSWGPLMSPLGNTATLVQPNQLSLTPWVKEVTNWNLQRCKQDGDCQFSFWNIMLCWLVNSYQHSAGHKCSHLQGLVLQFSKILTTICQLTQNNIPKDLNLQQHLYEDLTAHNSNCSYQHYAGHGQLSEL